MKKFLVVMLVLAAASLSQAALVTNNLVIHLDAAVGVTANASGYVSSWADQASLGGNSDAGMGNTALQPLLVQNAINGLPALRFDGVDDWMRINQTVTDGALDTDTISMFIVFKLDQSSETDQSLIEVASTGVANGSHHYGAWWDGNSSTKKLHWYSRSAAGGLVASSNTMPASGNLDSGYMMLSGFWRADNTVDSDFNGVAGPVNTGADSSGSYYQVWIGSNNGAAQDLKGDIAEILIYNTALGAADQQAVEDYLTAKYVPEPATMVLLGLGSIAAFIRRRA